MNKYSLVTLTFLFLGLTTNVFSQPEERDIEDYPRHVGQDMGKKDFPMGRSDDPHSRLDRMVNHLDLDDAQESSIREIFDESRSDLEDIGKRYRENQMAMEQLEPGDEDYQSSLEVLAVERGEIATEKTILEGTIKSRVNQQLTPDQIDLIQEDRKGIRDHGGKNRKNKGARKHRGMDKFDKKNRRHKRRLKNRPNKPS
jgi:Spy/CpxP family protein refolding chaperone